MALRAFLSALQLNQYESTLVASGFEDVTRFANFSDNDIMVMKEVLTSAGVLEGHVVKIKHAVQRCQDNELRLESNSPLKFDYGKQVPLLKILRDELSALKQQLDAKQRKVAEQQLVLDEERRMRKAEIAAQKQQVTEQQAAIAALRKQLSAVEKQKAAAVELQQAGAVKLQAGMATQRDAMLRASFTERTYFEQLEALRVSMEAEAARADAAEDRATAAEAKLAQQQAAPEPWEEPSSVC